MSDHEKLLRIAELVQNAVQHRTDRDWALMHLDLSEAAELAKQVAPLGSSPSQKSAETDNCAGLAQALKDCLELMRHDGYSPGTSATMADAEAALAKAGAA
ncbi:hypothetical protein [Herbaspirillum frisingense]|uniref:hypothetical protein n=1 Tax=Herbaspirillum frisingense TaxID=92645 RepID=UPI0039B0EC96